MIFFLTFLEAGFGQTELLADLNRFNCCLSMTEFIVYSFLKITYRSKRMFLVSIYYYIYINSFNVEYKSVLQVEHV